MSTLIDRSVWLPRSMRRKTRSGKSSSGGDNQRKGKRLRNFKRWEQQVIKSAHGWKHPAWPVISAKMKKLNNYRGVT
jgi:hypothetical protein